MSFVHEKAYCNMFAVEYMYTSESLFRT